MDALTKRAKFSEGAYLWLYQALYEAPDPVPALTTAEEAMSRAACAPLRAPTCPATLTIAD